MLMIWKGGEITSIVVIDDIFAGKVDSVVESEGVGKPSTRAK